MDTQPTSLNCPACGAPLDVDGTHAIVRCKFCGNTSVLPGVLSGQSAPSSSLEDIRKLAVSGDLSAAVAKFSQWYGGDSEEVRRAIDAIQAGRLVTPSTMGNRAPEELTEALQEVQQHLAAGDKIGAIKVYREHFDTSLARAKYAVEQIEAGQTLNPEKGFQTPAASVPKSSVTFQTSRASSRPAAIGGLIVVAFVVLIVGGILSLILFTPGGVLNPRYYSNGPAVILPSESSSAQDIATGFYNPDKDARYLGLIDGANGKLLWHSDALTGDGYLDAIASGPDLVYAANGSELLAYHISDGSLAWQANMPDKLNYSDSSLLVADSRVITANADQSIQAYDASTGDLAWSMRLNGYDRTLRLVDKSLLVVDYTENPGDYTLEFLDPATGQIQQQITPTCTHNDYPTNIDPGAGFIFDQNENALYLIYDSSYGCVQRLDLTSGQAAWEADSQDNFNFSPDGLQYLMTPSTLYFSNGSDLLAVDKASGNMHVLLTNPDYDLLPLAMGGDNLIVRARRTRGTTRFEVWGVNLSGQQVWQIDLQGAEPIDPPNDMAGLIDNNDFGWTWQLTPTGLVIVTFQGNPNQAVLETFNFSDGASRGKQAIALKKVSGDFYSVPTVIGRRGSLMVFQLETDLYSLDVSTGVLERIY